jgi:hypothetical protein
MNPALVVLNPRNIPPVLEAISAAPIPKLWLTGWTEAELADGVFAFAAEKFGFSHLIVISDDCEPLPGSVERVCEALVSFSAVTGWCRVDERSTTVNLCREPLRGDQPLPDAYSFMDAAEVPDGIFTTHFTGMSLTGMSVEMWRQFPFGVFAPEKNGWASDFHLSIRLRDAGIPIMGVKAAECVHHRVDWLKPDRSPGRELLIGKVPRSVRVEP